MVLKLLLCIISTNQNVSLSLGRQNRTGKADYQKPTNKTWIANNEAIRRCCYSHIFLFLDLISLKFKFWNAKPLVQSELATKVVIRRKPIGTLSVIKGSATVTVTHLQKSSLDPSPVVPWSFRIQRVAVRFRSSFRCLLCLFRLTGLRCLAACCFFHRPPEEDDAYPLTCAFSLA